MKGLPFNALILFSFFLFQPVFSNAQVDMKAVLDPYLLPKSIKKHHIQSLVIYLEMNKDDISERGSIAGKLEEFEFNAAGSVSYRLRSDNRGNPPFIAYGKGSYFEQRSYDKKGRLTEYSMENYQYTMRELMTYNSKGNQICLRYLNVDDTILTINFKWEKGRMIKAVCVSGPEGVQDAKREFDQQGRLKEMTTNNTRSTYSYETIKDSVYTTEKNINRILCMEQLNIATGLNLIA